MVPVSSFLAVSSHLGWLLLEVGAAPETLVTVALRSATLALGAAPSEVSQLVTLGAFDLVGFAMFLPRFVGIIVRVSWTTAEPAPLLCSGGHAVSRWAEPLREAPVGCLQPHQEGDYVTEGHVFTVRLGEEFLSVCVG